jgi:hypothetical protein
MDIADVFLELQVFFINQFIIPCSLVQEAIYLVTAIASPRLSELNTLKVHRS